MSKIHVKTVRGTERMRRAGYAFGREPIELDTNRLKKAQLDAIRAEPRLEVVDVNAGKLSAAEKAAAEKAAAEKAAADKAAANKKADK